MARITPGVGEMSRSLCRRSLARHLRRDAEGAVQTQTRTRRFAPSTAHAGSMTTLAAVLNFGGGGWLFLIRQSLKERIDRLVVGGKRAFRVARALERKALAMTKR